MTAEDVLDEEVEGRFSAVCDGRTDRCLVESEKEEEEIVGKEVGFGLSVVASVDCGTAMLLEDLSGQTKAEPRSQSRSDTVGNADAADFETLVGEAEVGEREERLCC